MADLAHEMGGDLRLTASGDLAISDGSQEIQERVLRRILTNLGDHIWELDFGAGLPGFVGQVVDEGRIAAVVRSQMRLEAGVRQVPEPAVEIQAGTDGTVVLRVRYVDAETGAATSLSVPLPR